jgi:hypothetical protein
MMRIVIGKGTSFYYSRNSAFCKHLRFYLSAREVTIGRFFLPPFSDMKKFITILIGLLIAGGIAYSLYQSSISKVVTDNAIVEDDAMVQDDEMMSSSDAVVEDDAMINADVNVDADADAMMSSSTESN